MPTSAVRRVFLVTFLLISTSAAAMASAAGSDPANATYEIDGDIFTLRDGVAKVASAPGSASHTVVRLLDVPVLGDIDGDGQDDAVSWLTMQTGGSGTFYYIVAALRRADGFVGTKAILIGDRIEPQQLIVRGGGVMVRYRDRKPSEPFSAAPSVARSRDLTLGWLGAPARPGFLDDEITVTEPAAAGRITSPLRVRGTALGRWFSEGEVSLELRDEDGQTLARGFASAQGPWMVQGPVPFDGTLAFRTAGSGQKAWLVVKRNNPSDRRDLDREVRIPVILR